MMRGLPLALFISGLLWVAIFWGVSEFARTFADVPPSCADSAPVCEITGPGGKVSEWRRYVLFAALDGKAFHVPRGWCASACVLAVGLALHIGSRVTIDPRAVFQVHCTKLFYAQPMPDWFRRLALRDRPASNRGCNA